MQKKSLARHRTSVDENLPSDLVNTFHHAIWPFLAIAQFMGVMPVAGVCEKDVIRVHFKWIYVGVLVTITLIGLATIDLFLCVKIIFERGLKTYTAGPVTFSLTSVLGLTAFLGLARHWPDLMRQFIDTEKIFLKRSYETKESKGFCFRFRLYGGLLLFGAVVEHSMYISRSIYNNYYQINKCNLTVNFWENFFMRERLHLFSVIDFRMWMIPICEWLTISMTFTCNFVDILLMLITSSLALRFDQVNKSIRRLTAVVSDEMLCYAFDRVCGLCHTNWLRARLDFMSLLDLLQSFDEHLSNLVLLSCANDLYFICFQVLQSFQKRGNTIDVIYFWYSFCFVLTRILTMMLSAASINDTANDILATFYEIPLDYWGTELERFYEIVASDMISFSGKGFFCITRRMIFAMAGTVVTYELVLFDQVKDVVDHFDFCISRKV